MRFAWVNMIFFYRPAQKKKKILVLIRADLLRWFLRALKMCVCNTNKNNMTNLPMENVIPIAMKGNITLHKYVILMNHIKCL